MQILLHEQNTKIIPVYMRSAQHLHADLISRNKTMPDWHLSRPMAQKLFLSLGYPQVDLMATSNSNQVYLYFSTLTDDGPGGIDAFTKDWDRFTLSYIFPPPPMVELVLNRIYQCSSNSSFILITPWRVGALWFPKGTQAGNPTSDETPGLMEHRGGHGGARLPSHQQQGRQDKIRRLEAYRFGRPQVGELSAGALETLQSSWAKNTQECYGLGFRYWTQ